MCFDLLIFRTVSGPVWHGAFCCSCRLSLFPSNCLRSIKSLIHIRGRWSNRKYRGRVALCVSVRVNLLSTGKNLVWALGFILTWKNQYMFFLVLLYCVLFILSLVHFHYTFRLPFDSVFYCSEYLYDAYSERDNIPLAK